MQQWVPTWQITFALFASFSNIPYIQEMRLFSFTLTYLKSCSLCLSDQNARSHNLRSPSNPLEAANDFRSLNSLDEWKCKQYKMVRKLCSEAFNEISTNQEYVLDFMIASPSKIFSQNQLTCGLWPWAAMTTCRMGRVKYHRFI